MLLDILLAGGCMATNLGADWLNPESGDEENNSGKMAATVY